MKRLNGLRHGGTNEAKCGFDCLRSQGPLAKNRVLGSREYRKGHVTCEAVTECKQPGGLGRIRSSGASELRLSEPPARDVPLREYVDRICRSPLGIIYDTAIHAHPVRIIR